jgi:hypothetical protein
VPSPSFSFHQLSSAFRRTYYEAGRFLPISVGWRAVLGWVEPRKSLPPFSHQMERVQRVITLQNLKITLQNLKIRNAKKQESADWPFGIHLDDASPALGMGGFQNFEYGPRSRMSTSSNRIV